MFHITVQSTNPGKHELGHCMLGVYLANHSDRSSAMTHLEQHVQSPPQCSPSAALVSLVCLTQGWGKKISVQMTEGLIILIEQFISLVLKWHL